MQSSTTNHSPEEFDAYVRTVQEDVLTLGQSHDEFTISTTGDSLRNKLKGIPKGLHELVLSKAAGDVETLAKVKLVFSP